MAILDSHDTGGLAVKARCAGLLGAIVRDVAPTGYAIDDDRYHKMLTETLAIFEPGQRVRLTIEERIAAAEALGQAEDPRLNPKHQQRWVRFPEGRFWRGAQAEDPVGQNFDREAVTDESPVREIHLSAFEMTRYPLTVQEFAGFVDDDGYEKKTLWATEGFELFEKPKDWEEQLQFPNRPIVGVSWYEANAFARWCNCRLPTEAEWERAARGLDARKFPWGNDEPNSTRLNFIRAGFARPTIQQ